MKALVRNKGETVTEDMGIPGIDWETGMPLTNPYWAEGPYTLIQNYTPPADEGSAVSEATPTETQNSGVTLTPEEVARLKEALSSL